MKNPVIDTDAVPKGHFHGSFAVLIKSWTVAWKTKLIAWFKSNNILYKSKWEYQINLEYMVPRLWRFGGFFWSLNRFLISPSRAFGDRHWIWCADKVRAKEVGIVGFISIDLEPFSILSVTVPLSLRACCLNEWWTHAGLINCWLCCI